MQFPRCIVLAALLTLPASSAAAQPRMPAGGPQATAPGGDPARPEPSGTDDGDGASETAADPAPGSPRASIATFFEHARDARWAEAARHLELPDPPPAEPAVLARRLAAVLARHAWIDLHDLSPAPEGRLDDGHSRNVEEIATIPGADGATDLVLLVRRPGRDPAWIFTRQTVEHVDEWYGALQDRWVLEHVPAPLLRMGPGNLQWWQWIALLPLFCTAFLGSMLLTWATSGLLRRGAARTSALWDDHIIGRLRGPLRLAWTLILARPLLRLLDLYAPADAFMASVLRTGFFIAFLWALLRGSAVVGDVVLRSPWATEHLAARSLVPLGVKIAKISIVIFGTVAVLSSLGYPVASLIAGLGIGGLAVALAAQKTVENLFGSVSLGVDQPFVVGDFVKVEDIVGTVETIGLRSTRIRTLDRTIVTLPNGRLADMRLESFSARDRMRFATTVGVSYSTTASQMRAVLEGLERTLRSHPKIWPDAVVVRLKEFGASSLDIEIMAWFQVAEWSELQLHRQEVLLQFMQVIEDAGTSLAFPTRTVHLITEGGKGLGPDPDARLAPRRLPPEPGTTSGQA